MAIAKFKSFRIEDAVFGNHLNGTMQLHLQHTYSYTVKYNQSNICRGEMQVTVKDPEHEDALQLKVTGVAFFEFDPQTEKEKLHVETFHIAFAHLRAFVLSFSAQAGIPPIILQEPNLEGQSIIRIDTSGLR